MFSQLLLATYVKSRLVSYVTERNEINYTLRLVRYVTSSYVTDQTQRNVSN
jgi:hypothetical protein